MPKGQIEKDTCVNYIKSYTASGIKMGPKIDQKIT